jgi:hypothetical protein
MYKQNPNYPFPNNTRKGKRSAYFELIDYEKDIFQYIVLTPIAFFITIELEIAEPETDPVFIEKLWPEVKLLDHMPDPHTTFWLYRLESFKVEGKFHYNYNTFTYNSKDYEKFIFDDYNILIEFCQKRYGVNVLDFKERWETNMPC